MTWTAPPTSMHNREYRSHMKYKGRWSGTIRSESGCASDALLSYTGFSLFSNRKASIRPARSDSAWDVVVGGGLFARLM